MSGRPKNAAGDRPGRRARAGARGLKLPLIAALCAMAVVAPASLYVNPPTPPTRAYFEQVREQVRSIPLMMGPYVGQDAEVAQAARELLRPNAILQRRYSPLSRDRGFSLLITHCGDARDMYGHYPRNCYPNAGWRLMTTEVGEIPDGDGGTIPVELYRFESQAEDESDKLLVYNFFALPSDDRPFATDMDTLWQVVRQRSVRGMGVAQFQVLFDGNETEENITSTFEALMPRLRPVIQTVVRGPAASASEG